MLEGVEPGAGFAHDRARAGAALCVALLAVIFLDDGIAIPHQFQDMTRQAMPVVSTKWTHLDAR
jgi:hypothetical protein